MSHRYLDQCLSAEHWHKKFANWEKFNIVDNYRANQVHALAAGYYRECLRAMDAPDVGKVTSTEPQLHLIEGNEGGFDGTFEAAYESTTGYSSSAGLSQEAIRQASAAVTASLPAAWVGLGVDALVNSAMQQSSHQTNATCSNMTVVVKKHFKLNMLQPYYIYTIGMRVEFANGQHLSVFGGTHVFRNPVSAEQRQ